MSKSDEPQHKASSHQIPSDHQFTHLPTVWCDDKTSATLIKPQYASKSARIPRIPPTEVILAAWASTVSIFTASEDVVFGVSIEDGRYETSDQAGIYPLRLTLSPDQGVEQVVQHVADIISQLHFNADFSHAITRTTYKLGTLLRILETKSPQTQSATEQDIEHAGFPIEISFQISDLSTDVIISFQQHLYTQQYIDEILRQTIKTIDVLVDGSELTPHDPGFDMLLTWTRPCEQIPRNPLLHTGVERQSRSIPNSIAIGQSERVMTYQELNRGAELLADNLAAKLQAKASGQNVGIYFEKSPFAIMSMLAVLKAGATYVPLDVDWPQQRIATVVENANINTIFCSKAQRSRLQDDTLSTVTVDEWSLYDMKSKSSGYQQRQRKQIDPSSPAYILYTSGSTGAPKGIPVSHSAITTSIQAIARTLDINMKTRTFQYTTFTFDLNIADIWMTLSHGGRICLPAEDERLNPSDFVAQERCNYAMITPTAASTIDLTTLHENIRTLALIGESVPEQLMRRLATAEGSLKLYNTWGPTEASVIASSSKNVTLKDNCHLSLHPNDVGQPVGCSIFLVSPSDPDQLAPAFAPGEIALVGHTLANGYYDNPVKTSEAFRRNLKWTKNKSLLARVGSASAMSTVYLTGDIGRYNPIGDGSVIFMYRKEGGYVKINGYRVDPGEIETRVSQSGLSQNGVCVLSHDIVDTQENENRQVLVCFFVTGNGQGTPGSVCQVCEPRIETTKAVKQAKASLRDAVPEYMIPRLFVPVLSMPILTSHKVDRKSLLAVLKGRSWSDLVQRFGS